MIAKPRPVQVQFITLAFGLRRCVRNDQWHSSPLAGARSMQLLSCEHCIGGAGRNGSTAHEPFSIAAALYEAINKAYAFLNMRQRQSK